MPIARRLRRLFFDQAAAWCVLFRRPDRALEFYGKMLALDPGDTLALSSMGYQTAQQGRRREALAIFDRLLTVAPGDAEAYFNRGYLLQELGDHGQAIEAFEHAIGINPNHDRAHYGCALSLIATRRLEEAIVPLRKNTVLQPMSPYGWYQLARVQHELGRTSEAQKVIDHLARFEPKIARQLGRETGLRADILE